VLDLDSAGIPASILRVDLPAGFAGSAFDVRGTRAITTTGSPEGNDLYVTDLATGTTVVEALPQAADDPGAARFLSEDTAFVPARGTGRVYRFVVPTPGFADLAGDVAQSPVDVVPFGGRLYLIDANEDRSLGTVLGPSRVVALDPVTRAADTVFLGGQGAIRGAISGGRLLVLQAGPSDVPGGKLAALDLGGAQPVLEQELDLQGIGISMEGGLDGFLYVVLAADPATPEERRVVVVDPASLTFVVPPDDALDLRRPDGTAAACQAAAADSEGGIYCLEPEGGGFLYVYGPDLEGRVAISLGAGPRDLLIAAIP
ncbi:MAG: hypothetical protein ACREKI_09740, partial [Gemmatimonadota bacterium]